MEPYYPKKENNSPKRVDAGNLFSICLSIACIPKMGHLQEWGGGGEAGMGCRDVGADMLAHLQQVPFSLTNFP